MLQEHWIARLSCFCSESSCNDVALLPCGWIACLLHLCLCHLRFIDCFGFGYRWVSEPQSLEEKDPKRSDLPHMNHDPAVISCPLAQWFIWSTNRSNQQHILTRTNQGGCSHSEQQLWMVSTAPLESCHPNSTWVGQRNHVITWLHAPTDGELLWPIIEQ